MKHLKLFLVAFLPVGLLVAIAATSAVGDEKPLAATKVFDEVDGTVIMEMESTQSPLGQWKQRTKLVPFTGTSYLEFMGNNPGVGAPNSPLHYDFRINTAGNYWLSIRSHKRLTGNDGVTARSDMCNDCYVRVEGDYESANPKLPLEWLKKDMKFWGNAADLDWKNWSSKIVGEHDAIKTVRYKFKAGKQYRLVVSGRAQRFSLDRIVITRVEDQRFTKTVPESRLIESRSVKASRPPNIVLIFIDDMGYGDISPFGNEVLRTPHLKSMASQGRTFTHFYASPVCTMSRASLLTGSYNVRISMPSVIQPPSQIGLNPNETNIANLLKRKGYATACIGKWHLGHRSKFLPHNQGFDTYFGIPYSNNMTDDYMKGKAPPLPLYENDEIVETEPDQSQFTKRFTERTVKFIKANQDKPFFVYLPHPMIHTPLFASKDFKGKSKMGILGDAIEEIDWSLGQITKTLDDLGLTENTLVVFTSDNGPAHHAAGKLRGVKGSTHEGGVRVPTVMSWPGKIAAGSKCDQIAGTIDILPTIAQLVEAPLDPDRPIDGADISSLLFESEPGPVRDIQLYYGWSQTGHLDAIRQGKWKLFLGSKGQPPKRYDDRASNYRTRPVGEFETALYDLEADPSETTDVSDQHPEIAARLKTEATKRDGQIKGNLRPIGMLDTEK